MSGTVTTSGPGAVPGAAIVRQGDQLVVPRGADFSDCCFQCAAAPAGRPIVRYLRARRAGASRRATYLAGGGIIGLLLLLIDLLLFVLWLVWLVADLPKARRRRVSFSLCARHRRRHRLYTWLTRAGLPLGIALVLIGIFGNQPAEWDLLPYLPGCILVFCGLMAFGLNPEPKLAGENAEFLWIGNAGAAFLARQPRQGG